MQRALDAGVKWLALLRHLRIAFGDYEHGNARLYHHVLEALSDSVMHQNPPLHADLIIFKLDDSFAPVDGSFRASSNEADWNALYARESGQDVVSLARHVVSAYVKKLGQPSVTAFTVWDDEVHARRINQ